MGFRGTSFSGKNFHIVSNIGHRIQANIPEDNKFPNISGEGNSAEYKEISNQPPQLTIIINNPIHNNNSLNQSVATNKSIFQFTIENIPTISTQQNISIEFKTMLQSQVKEFEEESRKPNEIYQR